MGEHFCVGVASQLLSICHSIFSAKITKNKENPLTIEFYLQRQETHSCVLWIFLAFGKIEESNILQFID